jgi:hypothetical protein
MSIIDTSKKQPRIIDTSPRQPRVDPAAVAKALGAEIVERPKVLVGNTPELFAQIQQAKSGEHSIKVSSEDWEKLCALANELKEGEKAPSPDRVALVLLRRALREQLEGKAQMKAQLYEAHPQPGE